MPTTRIPILSPPDHLMLRRHRRRLPPPSYSRSPPPSSFGVNDSWSDPPSRTTTLSSFNNYGFNVPTYSTSAASFTQNPFAASLATPPDAGLSFGGVDGSITTSSPANVSDPWSMPTHVGRRKNTADFSSNPWSWLLHIPLHNVIVRIQTSFQLDPIIYIDASNLWEWIILREGSWLCGVNRWWIPPVVFLQSFFRPSFDVCDWDRHSEFLVV